MSLNKSLEKVPKYTEIERRNYVVRENSSYFNSFVDQDTRCTCTFQRNCPIVYITYCLEDIATISLEIVEKPNKCTVSYPHFFLGGGDPDDFYGRLLAQFTVYRLVEFPLLTSICEA